MTSNTSRRRQEHGKVLLQAFAEVTVPRLITATLSGTALAAVVVFRRLLLHKDGAFTTLQAIYKLTTWGEMLGFTAGALLLFGAGPTIVIGAVLILVRRSSPILLVATPATLFLFTLIEVVRERNKTTNTNQHKPTKKTNRTKMFVM